MKGYPTTVCVCTVFQGMFGFMKYVILTSNDISCGIIVASTRWTECNYILFVEIRSVPIFYKKVNS